MADVSAAHAIVNDLIKQYLLFTGRFLDDVLLGGAVQGFADVFTQLTFPNSPIILRATGSGPGSGWIWKHEKGFGGAGHTILKHVWVDDKDLEKRWAARSASKADLSGELSYFQNEETAEHAISQTIKANKAKISAWARNSSVLPTLELDHEGDGSIVGRGMKYGDPASSPRTGTKVVLLKNRNGKGWSILTAHPK